MEAKWRRSQVTMSSMPYRWSISALREPNKTLDGIYTSTVLVMIHTFLITDVLQIDMNN